MASPARAALESLLQSKKLDRTLTTAIRPGLEYAFTGIAALDQALSGGLPRGELSEIVGPRSSGRTTALWHALASATARGELVALVDALDMLDVESAAATGVDLDRVLWIRGHVVTNPGLCRDLNQRALEQAIRALALVLQAGNFGVVALDVAEAPVDAIRRLPFTTWLRLQRMVEGSHTACVLAGSEPVARSSAGLTLRFTRGRESALESACGPRGGGAPRVVGNEGQDRSVTHERGWGPASIRDGITFRGRVFEGLSVRVRIARARTGAHASATFTTVSHA